MKNAPFDPIDLGSCGLGLGLRELKDLVQLDAGHLGSDAKPAATEFSSRRRERAGYGREAAFHRQGR